MSMCPFLLQGKTALATASKKLIKSGVSKLSTLTVDPCAKRKSSKGVSECVNKPILLQLNIKWIHEGENICQLEKTSVFPFHFQLKSVHLFLSSDGHNTNTIPCCTPVLSSAK